MTLYYQQALLTPSVCISTVSKLDSLSVHRSFPAQIAGTQKISLELFAFHISISLINGRRRGAIGSTLDLQCTGHGFKSWSGTITSYLHLCASVTKQYNLVQAKEPLHSAAGKVIVRLASHWSCVYWCIHLQAA